MEKKSRCCFSTLKLSLVSGWALFTTSAMTAAWLVANAVPFFDGLVELIGSICATAFFLPGLLFRRAWTLHTQGPLRTTDNFASEALNLTILKGQKVFIEWDNRWSTESFFWTLEYCVDNYTGPSALTGIQGVSAHYEADGIIESSQSVIGPMLNVKYDAAQAIDLLPGFQIDTGNVFRAIIDGCGGPE